MWYFACETRNYSIECFAKQKKSLKSLVRKGLEMTAGKDGCRWYLKEYPDDFDTENAQDFDWLDGKDFIMLDGKEVAWIEGRGFV